MFGVLLAGGADGGGAGPGAQPAERQGTKVSQKKVHQVKVRPALLSSHRTTSRPHRF